jgi:hypothetical protein
LTQWRSWPRPIDEEGNKVAVELAPGLPYHYEIRIEKDGSTRYQPAGQNHTDAEARRLRMIEKKDVKTQAKNLGMTVIDPEESKTSRPTLKDTADLYIEDCRKRNVLEAMEQTRLVAAEFPALTRLTYADEVTRDAILTFDDEASSESQRYPNHSYSQRKSKWEAAGDAERACA